MKSDIDIWKGNGETILLVDDEAAIRTTSSKLLNMLGYKVLEAQDGMSALEFASTSIKIDLLLSDIVLPGGMNGIQIFEQILEIRPEIKCLFMSGYAAQAYNQLPAGTELIQKPYQILDLAKKLRQFLDD